MDLINAIRLAAKNHGIDIRIRSLGELVVDVVGVRIHDSEDQYAEMTSDYDDSPDRNAETDKMRTRSNDANALVSALKEAGLRIDADVENPADVLAAADGEVEVGWKSTHQIVNLTPHTITIMCRRHVTIPSTGIARVYPALEESTETIIVDGTTVPIYRTAMSNRVTCLPDEKPGVWYVVSKLVYDACPERDDLVIPHHVVRNGKGESIGCRGFAKPIR
jgi:hypothetical protein